ncbi:bifunctional ADP-dependent NAD(P)H-hydrate dehydratase/NAD(P)H-hydrate epimerase [Aldersonia kunmingensis]|uniref:bifunctional ADP-dependent NAD(P)H-hydrate dehydratase/NAD(P)H-hydrate epimerase n=1 Tax=Aldersonia kunmingensis TaxID=408066 RepID=UPI00082A9E07|nr:bifunctional ADP-dependent NAD(P)H-hydrate dehydratase/NAD(P)H-hydrate epimerase [Aldersonia kunmingensis]
MREFHTADEVRAAEAVLFEQVAEGVPMQRAAYGLAVVCAAELRARTGGVVGRRVCLLVGSGDNGGDALWAGSMLRRRGAAVTALLLAPEKAHAKGLAALRASGGRVMTDLFGDEHRGALADADLVVDGIVGISGRGPLRPDAARVVADIEAPIVAADLPSGVDPDTGDVSGPAVRADVTVSFGALKPVHALAAEHCGRIEFVPIGLAPPPAGLRALEPGEVGALWPVPDARADKYSQGVVGVCAGSARYPGAGVLCTSAAVAATSGMVRYAGSGADQVLARSPEVVAAPAVAETGRVQAWVFGPGSGTDDAALDTLRRVLASDVPVLIDADGLTMLAQHPDLVRGRSAPTVLTPHAGEFERLTGTAPGPDRVGAVREFASRWGVTALLKGRATLIAAPDGPVLVNEAGGSWAATAGAGDVLSGIIGALLSTGLEPALAAAAGTRAHALAANLAASTAAGSAGLVVGSAPAPISADVLLAQVRAAIAVLRAQATGE